MKVIRECPQEEVLDHWIRLYNYRTIFFRCDILENLTNDLHWSEVEIEKEDIDKLFIISSDDWGPGDAGITTIFKVVEIVENLKKGIRDDRIMPKILEYKKRYEEDIDSIDRKFILISPKLEGNYTILDGNKRTVALQSIDRLVGNVVYLGVSENVERGRGLNLTRYARARR